MYLGRHKVGLLGKVARLHKNSRFDIVGVYLVQPVHRSLMRPCKKGVYSSFNTKRSPISQLAAS